MAHQQWTLSCSSWSMKGVKVWLFLSTPQKKASPLQVPIPCVTGSYDQIPSMQSPYLLLGEDKFLFKSCQTDSQVAESYSKYFYCYLDGRFAWSSLPSHGLNYVSWYSFTHLVERDTDKHSQSNVSVYLKEHNTMIPVRAPTRNASSISIPIYL